MHDIIVSSQKLARMFRMQIVQAEWYILKIIDRV